MTATTRPRALLGLSFFPRGGSAHVTRALALALPRHGWDVTVLAPSLRIPGRPGDAVAFFAGCDVRALDVTAALSAPDPLLADPPLHPSYEDRPGAPDRVFAALDDATFEHHVGAWERALRDAGAEAADVLHLNHLTPMHEAARRVAPRVPIVGHLHGTELLMLEQIAAGAPAGWDHAERWAQRMRAWAQACERLIVISETQVERARSLLDIEPGRCTFVPNGFDPQVFERRSVDRRAHWRRHLVTAPLGWRPGGEPGSIAYDEADLAAFAEGPTLLYVGRFTAVKRIGLLIRAYTRARRDFRVRAPLVLLGGFPGEWEGEHPLDAITAAGVPDVFLAGWHGHDELPDFYAAADVVVLASVREQFGQTLVEGMACGLPAIAVDSHGPAEIIVDGETGWLVEPDDEASLVAALVAAVNEPAERERRGAAAHGQVRDRYAWPALAGRVAQVYAELTAARRGSFARPGPLEASGAPAAR